MPTDELLNEITNGQGETLSRLARRVPSTRQGKAVTSACLVRWVLTGAKGPGGQRVRLEAARVAGKWISTAGALKRFIRAQTPGRQAEGLKFRKAKRRDEAAARAEAELEAAGV
jgi:hypothetical protein